MKVYDKAILDNLTDKFNLTEEEIERLKAKKTHWWDDFVNFYRQFDVTPLEASDEKKHVTSMQIYNAEAKILLGLAKQESCIIVGRSGFHIFRDDPHAMKIFIIADEKHRVERYANKYGVSETEAQSIIHEIDNAREAFTKTFAGTSRYDARNYDLVCNVTGLNTEHVTSFLAEIIRRRFQTEKQESSQERAYPALDVKMKHRIMVIDDTPEMMVIFRFVFQDDEDIEIITSS